MGKNDAGEDERMLFEMERIKTWPDYFKRHPSLESYTPLGRAYHIGNATGMGIYLDGPLIKKWGSVGVGPEGIVSREQFKTIATHAQNSNLPVIIEADYDVPNIPEKKYSEADPFLRYMLTSDGF
ncbi:hypothetical protein FJZ18_04175 [Candidatus Pacearchaeota archaeon]|nr:hypothetical protein [Candidatus Pacearchaeota archaeon]